MRWFYLLSAWSCACCALASSAFTSPCDTNLRWLTCWPGNMVDLPSKVFPISLNRASAEELARLPGMTPELAHALISYRDREGPFKSLEDLRHIPGYSAAWIEQWAKRLTLH